MGDISTHAEITHHVQNQLRRLRPDENYTYLEIGNFIRDVSQFRDPYAHFLAKNRVRVQATTSRFPLPLFGFPITSAITSEWINTLLGQTEAGKRHGKLAQFLSKIAHFTTHYMFAEDSRIHRLPDTDTDFQPISPDAVDEIFDATFTQYYPHEHLDLPPYREGPNHRNLRLYQPQGRDLIGYLEEQIQYLAEELSKIEQSWLRGLNTPQNRLLARLGRVLHAVEDYYFHSNFMEIYHWKRLLVQYPGKNPTIESDRNFLLRNSVRGQTLEDGYHMKRRFARRLRYPVFTRNAYIPYRFAHSHSESEDATKCLYTGGFAANDIFHTLHGAVKAFESIIDRTPDRIKNKIQNTSLALLLVVFNEEVRRSMVADEGYANSMIKKHGQDLNQDLYKDGIEALRVSGDITDRCAALLQEAFEMDKTLENEYKMAPGIGGFLITFFKIAQKTVDDSEARSRTLNNSVRHIYNKASDIGATGELIGQHTLLAKDTNNQLPFRIQSLALAKHASASIAHLLVKRIGEDARLTRGMDWDTILRHYMRFPNPESSGWERYIIENSERSRREDESYQVPNVEDVPDLANYRILGPGYGADKLNARIAGDKRQVLERRYKDLEARA